MKRFYHWVRKLPSGINPETTLLKLFLLGTLSLFLLRSATVSANPVFEIPAKAPINKYFSKRLLIPVINKISSKPAGIISRVNHLFGVDKINDRYYFNIPDSLLGREMVVVTRLVKTPPKISVERQQFGGEQLNAQVWKWEKHGNRLLISVTDYSEKADASTNMLTALSNSDLNTILYAFEIKKRDAINHQTNIDVTDFYNGDVFALGISDAIRKAYKVSSLDASRSYIDTIKSFPGNIEVKTIKTYHSETSPTDNTNGAITFELNTSMLLLPETLMQPRITDQRIGYFSRSYTNFGNGTQPAKTTKFISRWRLEPKDTSAYNRGELVEPKKQIVFYVDPATPEEWVPYFIKGVNAWQKAFEAAGFKNAIVCRPAPNPNEDPEFSTEDARYNVIRYFASDEENAYGPTVTDPRTGEIIESHLGWYHNQIKELHDWYFIQTSAANPKARGISYTTEQVGELICTTISHEIGHTLGLLHNWAASNAYSTDSLRSKNFTDHHGIAASIMDYARFNYVAQPGDGVTQFNPKIGEYDVWAIKWGYSWFPGQQAPEKEKLLLDKWTIQKAGNPLYFFGKEMTFYDPRAQHEDLGDNAMAAGRCGIANLKRILPNLKEWTYQPGKDESDVLDLYQQVIQQYYQYARSVNTYVGGVYYNFKTYDEQVKGYEPVNKLLQKSAVAFLVQEVYTTPTWLIDKKELSDIDNALIVNKIQAVQFINLSSLLDVSRLARMLDNELKQGSQAYTVSELLDDLNKGIFNSASPDVFKRSLQREYIDLLQKLVSEHNKSIEYMPVNTDEKQGYPPVNVSMTDIKPLVMAHLKYINSHIPIKTDGLMKSHWADLRIRIESILKHEGE